MDKKLIHFELNNGVRVIHSPAPGKIVHCALMINAGTRDEEEENTGIAHLIEHCIFKGTKTKSSLAILNRIDSVGGELNAYTTKEETCVYVSCGLEYFERAIELLTDIVLNSTFPEKEINKEKEVIFDEIHSYLDSPAEQIHDDFEALIFRDHPLGRNILGDEKRLKAVKRNALIKFVGKHYGGKKIVFSSSGDLSSLKLKHLSAKYLGKFSSQAESTERKPFSTYKVVKAHAWKDTFQTHCLLGTTAYDSLHKNRTPMILLNNLLGGPAMNSRLNLGIREKFGITYNLDSSYVPYTDSGIFNIYFGTDPSNMDQTLSLIHLELKKLRDRKLSDVQLQNAKDQLCGQVTLSQESRLGSVLNNAKNMLLFGKVDSFASWLNKVKAISSSQLLEISNEVFDEKQLSMLVFAKK
jgi:predicted Zn-dependent peptidase